MSDFDTLCEEAEEVMKRIVSECFRCGVHDKVLEADELKNDIEWIRENFIPVGQKEFTEESDINLLKNVEDVLQSLYPE